MTDDTLRAIVTVVTSAGGLALIGTLAKGLRDWVTGRQQRIMHRAHTAIENLAIASKWAELYYNGLTYCRDHHKATAEYIAGYPRPDEKMITGGMYIPDRPDNTTDKTTPKEE